MLPIALKPVIHHSSFSGADPEILKGGAHNARVPNYRVPALTPF